MRPIVVVTIAISLITINHILAHVTHHNTPESKTIQYSSQHDEVNIMHISGQGNLKFRILYNREHFPTEVVNAIDKAHGGFDVDRRNGKGETYFALPGVGIIQISADLKTVQLIDTPTDLKNANAHYTTVWTATDGKPYLSFPANDVGRIFTTTLDGKLIHTLYAPDGTFDFGNQVVNTYFRDGGKFVPTGVTHDDGMLFVTTGYSDLDYILGAKLTSLNPFKASWYPLAFGGKGDEPGQFGTGHHITVPYGKNRLDISDRANAEVERYTTDGTYLETLSLIKGSFPCSIDHEAGYAVVACLFGPNKEKGAPLYILEGDNLVSTVRIKDELKLETFQHLHGAVIRKIDEKFYIIAQSWNPGDIVILEQTK